MFKRKCRRPCSLDTVLRLYAAKVKVKDTFFSIWEAAKKKKYRAIKALPLERKKNITLMAGRKHKVHNGKNLVIKI